MGPESGRLQVWFTAASSTCSMSALSSQRMQPIEVLTLFATLPEWRRPVQSAQQGRDWSATGLFEIKRIAASFWEAETMQAKVSWMSPRHLDVKV